MSAVLERTPGTQPSPPEGITERETKDPTIQKLTQLFFLSYYHSQGLFELQYAMFEWFPHCPISDDQKQAIMKSVRPMAENFLRNSQDRTSDSPKVVHPAIWTTTKEKPTEEKLEEHVGQQLTEALDHMQTTFNEPLNLDPLARNVLLVHIARMMIERDFKNLFTWNEETQILSEKGRLRKKTNPNIATGDPWLSFVCHYGLNGQTTGMEEYDALYREITKDIRSGSALRNFKTDVQFSNILDLYNQKHPDKLAEF